MIQLPNGCRRSQFNVVPNNWKTTKAKLSLNWYADCRFIDPLYLDKYPKGKPIRLKGGVNRLNTLSERKTALEKLIEEMEERFRIGYNPITENLKEPYAKVQDDTYEVFIGVPLPTTPFIKAFRIALEHSTNVKESVADIRSIINSIETAATTLGFENFQIGEIEVKHIKRCLDQCHKTNPRFSAKRYNKAKAYLSGLFKYLIQEGAVHGNMARAVNPMKEEVTRPHVFAENEIERIKKHLWENNRPFYHFMMIFYYSGGRIKELMRLKGKDVDLLQQTYTTLVKKGKARWVSRTIRNVALPYWKVQIENCDTNDYVFSLNLLPGPIEIDSHQVTRRWMVHVKKPLGIQTTFYKLKHLNTDRTLQTLGAKMAAGQNAHASTKMVEEVYAYNEKIRIHETLKGLDIEL